MHLFVIELRTYPERHNLHNGGLASSSLQTVAESKHFLVLGSET